MAKVKISWKNPQSKIGLSRKKIVYQMLFLQKKITHNNFVYLKYRIIFYLNF